MEDKSWTYYFARIYIQHEASPLSHMKVQKAEPIIELVNGALVGNS
jgi:hypothetical protein